ncbi:MAG: archaeal proteasome endopeptidase complex subunit beta [Candidatus Bathyarchaeota archaeon]|nr:archaeal proteasome endopeptidase complex subunit beta [Candidatus Bathyarchaeota archaeon]
MNEKLALKGTTTIGIICRDGVILASDTRVTMGFFVAHKQGKKIYQIDDHMAMTISGVVADAQRIVDILKANAHLYKLEIGRPMPVSAGARLIANLLFSSRLAPMVTQALVGGVDDSGPHVFSVDPFGSLTEEKCVATGSGSPIAYGVLEDRYKKDANVKDMLPTVVRAVDSAMKRDAASGDSFDIVIINKEGLRELNDKEKKGILGNS